MLKLLPDAQDSRVLRSKSHGVGNRIGSERNVEAWKEDKGCFGSVEIPSPHFYIHGPCLLTSGRRSEKIFMKSILEIYWNL